MDEYGYWEGGDQAFSSLFPHSLSAGKTLSERSLKRPKSMPFLSHERRKVAHDLLFLSKCFEFPEPR